MCVVMGLHAGFISNVLDYRTHYQLWFQRKKESRLVLSSVYYYVTIRGLSLCKQEDTGYIFPMQLGLIILSIVLAIG